jgi:2-amino-4-hydroxy-6-hydroxymethyldihydropteridine diphosphokinase
VIRTYVALGGNIEPERRLLQAATLLKQHFPGVVFSSCYQNQAVGFDGADFINAAAGFDTTLSLKALAESLHHIEEQCGRQRDDAKWAPRAMDLDILLYGQLIDHGPAVRVPRADLLRRAYMLGPMAELAPTLLHPEARRTLKDLWQELRPRTPALKQLALELNGELDCAGLYGPDHC